MTQNTLPTRSPQEAAGPVECLGLTFPNDEARRACFLDKLREKLKDPAFRQIEGFPIGTDEDILALSDPPYYTACPNPFIAEFITYYGTSYDPNQPYNTEPFAFDLTEGKGDPIYNAHPYHTKVPPRAIVKLLMHYTDPGDLVLDAFSGSGMLGVAASLSERTEDFKQDSKEKAGRRYAILSDLSTLAGFIGNVNSRPDLSADEFYRLSENVVTSCRKELGWMFKTRHTADPKSGQGIEGDIIYTIWSEFYRCPSCSMDIRAWDVIVDRGRSQLRKSFHCPSCKTLLRKEALERVTETFFDNLLNRPANRNKSEPVWIHYRIGNKRFEKAPDEMDLALLARIDAMEFPASAKGVEMNFRKPPWGDLYRAGYHAGITHVHHFFTKRNISALFSLRDRAMSTKSYRQMLYILTGFVDNHSSKRNRYLIDEHHPAGTTCGPLSNSLYIPELQCEVNPFDTWVKTAKKQAKAFSISRPSCSISTTEASSLCDVAHNCIDYIFVDPPFGENIFYSESSFTWEYFLGVHTNPLSEAIISKAQRKDVDKYQSIIREVFETCFRVLKPGRWMTIEFSNRSNAVWNAISEAVQSSGFVVADVRVFDKKHGTIRQDLGQSIRKDLIISAYKPHNQLEERFIHEARTEDGVWSFVRAHLRQLPIFVHIENNQAEVVAERLRQPLFDRMVSFHVQRGASVPLSASEFFAGLAHRFPERDSMYFLPEQVAEYEKMRVNVHELQQLQLFISDETSAIQWIRQQLTYKPHTRPELTPQFLKELATWEKHEVQLELAELLEQNFLRYDGNGPIPAQILAWMKKSADLRDVIAREGREQEKGDLETDSPVLKFRAKDRWYVPDPNRAIDLEKVRLKGLLKEFATYQAAKGRLKHFRTEAVRAGFTQAWRDQDYETIVRMAERLPENVLYEDPDMLMYYDNASLLVK